MSVVLELRNYLPYSIMIQPLGNRIFVETVEEVMSSGIAIPETYQRESRIGIVKAVGNGRRNKKGERIPITTVKVGDKVLLPYALGPGSRGILIDGKRCYSIILEELLGVME